MTEPQSIAEVLQQKPVVIDTACSWVKPIYISRNDNMTAGTAAQVLAHNKAFVKACGEPKK